MSSLDNILRHSGVYLIVFLSYFRPSRAPKESHFTTVKSHVRNSSIYLYGVGILNSWQLYALCHRCSRFHERLWRYDISHNILLAVLQRRFNCLFLVHSLVLVLEQMQVWDHHVCINRQPHAQTLALHLNLPQAKSVTIICCSKLSCMLAGWYC